MDGIPHNGLCALLLAGTAMCAWTGGVDTTWENGGNWDNHAPSTLEGALFQNTTHTDVRLNTPITIQSIVFTNDAPAYTLTLEGQPVILSLTGEGVRNDSAVTQNIVLAPGGGVEVGSGIGAMAAAPLGTPTIDFYNNASASGGTGKVRYSGQGNLTFFNSSTAGNADVDITNGTVHFGDTSRAGTATIAIGSGARLEFADSSSADHSAITIWNGGALSMDRTTGGDSIDIQSGGQADITTAASGPTTGGADVTDNGAIRFHTALGETIGRYSFGALRGGGSLYLGGVAGDRPVELTVGSNGASTLYSGTITGTGTLIKTGAGSLVLTGASSAGGLHDAQGSIYASPDSLGNGPIQIDDKLYISEPGQDRGIFSTISGGGKLILSSGNTIGLNGFNTYSGGTDIQRGAFTFGNPNAFGTGTISIGRLGSIKAAQFRPAAGGGVPAGGITTMGAGGVGNGGVFSLANPIFLSGLSSVETSAGTSVYDTNADATINTNLSTLTLSGGISGPGSLIVNGGGVLQLTGDATHAGLTTIVQGTTLRLGNGGMGGSLAGDMDILGALEINLGRDFTYNGFLSGDGSITVGGSGLITFMGEGRYGGSLTIVQGGRLQFGDGTVGGGAAIGDVTDNGLLIANLIGTNTFGGVISGIGAVEIKGHGTIVVIGDNNYTGGTTVDPGATLQVGDGTHDGGIAGDIVDNGKIVVKQVHEVTLDRSVTGIGSIEFGGAGKVTIVTDQGFTGGMTIDQGSTVQLGDGIHGGGVPGDYVDNGMLIADLPADAVAGNQVSGTGAFRLTGGHILTLTGNNSFTGGTTIDSGSTLRLGDGTADGKIAGNVVDNGGFVMNLHDAATFAGLISGGGTLAIAGPGKVTLTGNNSATGATTIAAGSSLQLGSGGTSGMVAGPISIGGALTVNRSDNPIYAGALSGAGSFTKMGAGTLVYDGDGHLFTGLLSVNEGGFMLGDAATPSASLGGSATVAAGATLLGHGTLAGSLVNNGAVRPGGSIGTLTVGGNYSQAPGATLTLDVEPGGSSKLAVGGSASLGGTLALVYAPGTYTAHQYDLVTATGGITGTFATVTGTVPGGSVSQSISYSPNAVRLALASVVVAPANPSVRAAIPTALADNGMWDADRDYARARHARGGIWGEGSGRWGSLSGDATAAGYHANQGELAGGVDFDAAKVAQLGLAVSWSDTGLRFDDGSTASIDTLRFAGHARFASGPFSLVLRGSGARHAVSADRVAAIGQLAHARFHASELEAGARAAWTLDAGGWRIEPQLGVDIRGVRQDGYAETGATTFDVGVAPHDYGSLRPTAGLDVSRTIAFGASGKLRIGANATWSHELWDLRGTAIATASDGTRFGLTGPSIGRERLVLGLSLEGQIAKGVSVFAGAQTQPNTNGATSRSASGGLRIAF